MSHIRYWQICLIGSIILIVLSYSPIVLSPSNPEPYLFGLPRTLWAGILTYIGIIILVWIGTRVHPDYKGDQ